MTTKASDVIELGRARALLGCSPSTSLVEAVARAVSIIAEQEQEIGRLKSLALSLTEALAAERRENEVAR